MGRKLTTCVLMVCAAPGCSIQGAMQADQQAMPPAGQASAPALSTPSPRIDDLLPPGQALLMRRDGDLDGDGIDDVLVAFGPRDVAAQADAARGLLILRRGRDGSLTQAALATRAVPCARCGGMFGDPLSAIDVRKGGFTMRLEGGSRTLWSREFDFDYVPADRTWRLVAVRDSTLDRLEGTARQGELGAASLSRVPLEDFDPADFPSE